MNKEIRIGREHVRVAPRVGVRLRDLSKRTNLSMTLLVGVAVFMANETDLVALARAVKNGRDLASMLEA